MTVARSLDVPLEQLSIQNEKPTVAILMDVCDKSGNVKLSPRWEEALEAQGLETVRVDPKLTDLRDVVAILDKADGIFLPGGNTNIHPLRYGQEPICPTEIFGKGCVPHEEFSHNRDRVSAIMVRYALLTEKPLLGVCRGMQEMNVALGGSMQQRIHGHDHGYQDGANWKDLAHFIDVESGSLLAEAFGRAGSIHETSIHRQGMYRDDISAKLRISAMAEDGVVVEAIEHPAHPFMLGVQFHAELQQRQELNVGIFKSFAGAVRSYGQSDHDLMQGITHIIHESALVA